MMIPYPRSERRAARYVPVALAALVAGAVFVSSTVDAQAQHADAQSESDDTAALIADLFGENDERAAHARRTLLTTELDPNALVAIARAAEGADQLAVVHDIAKHHVLTRLRQEELSDLDDNGVIVGFQFTVMATAGQVGPGTDELIEQYPWGAQITTTTVGFPGFAYLQPGDMIVRVDGETFPADRLGGQTFLVDTVKAHALGEHVEMTLIRNGEAVELSIPLARAAALPAMYDARTITRDLIDPFLFLWEEAWADILFEAGYDEE